MQIINAVPSRDKFYVALQLLLFILYALPVSVGSFRIGYNLKLLCAIAMIIGGFTIIISLFQLRNQLSPFPSPRQRHQLIQSGLFKYVRHPIYSGILFFVVGFAAFQESVFKLIISLLLGVLFYLKSNYEEKLLTKIYKEYKDYKRRTGKFLPKFKKMQR